MIASKDVAIWGCKTAHHIRNIGEGTRGLGLGCSSVCIKGIFMLQSALTICSMSLFLPIYAYLIYLFRPGPGGFNLQAQADFDCL